jgi:hypothetical protein
MGERTIFCETIDRFEKNENAPVVMIFVRLVGAVGIENNDGRDFKDLRGMQGNTKLLKRDDGERKEILIAPLKLPGFLGPWNSFVVRFSPIVLDRKSASGPNLAARMASRQKLPGP